ncbi:hypothetical protein FOA52_000644 [Chlamydomonas sp. UWO 241]|nr:hypothetical protein FOA52_009061 [Chlamydomonas sp. UWO 241]KAG1668000.1 hypothetical protein FOA52_000644 [Chlamydomonas sp. UWO 241]
MAGGEAVQAQGATGGAGAGAVAVRAKARDMLRAALRDHLSAGGASTTDADSQAGALAGALEAALYAGPGRSETAGPYRTALRSLVPALRRSDDVAARFVGGELSAEQVVNLPLGELAPAALRAAMAAKAAKKASDEAAWEALQGIGGGTFAAGVMCRACGGAKVVTHTILSGGTYAQERETIQKYVCQECQETWRS